MLRSQLRRALRSGASLFFALLCLVTGVALAEESAPQISLGNGAENAIVVEGLSVEGRDITIPEVTLAHQGWVVLHPFADGRPRGEVYAGATWMPAGTHQNVVVRAQTVPMPEPGTPFLVMLHDDVNEDQVFDFVFVDERNVADRAVFEGTTMIAHIFQVPGAAADTDAAADY